MDANLLKEVACAYLLKRRRMAVSFEVGLVKRGRLRADVLGINLKRNVVVIETKSSPADFKSDKKWHKYMPLCTQFYFMMDVPTYNKVHRLIPEDSGAGIMVVGSSLRMMIVRNAKQRQLSESQILDLSLRLNYRSADRNRYGVAKAGQTRN
jgi:hypothetical protein